MSIYNGEVTQRDPTATSESENVAGSARDYDLGGASSKDYAQCGGTVMTGPPPARDVLRCTEDDILRITEDNIFRRIV